MKIIIRWILFFKLYILKVDKNLCGYLFFVSNVFEKNSVCFKGR